MDETPHDLLARAARQARTETDPRWHAVADLLDRWVWMTGKYPREQFPGSTLPQALAIAHALLNT